MKLSDRNSTLRILARIYGIILLFVLSLNTSYSQLPLKDNVRPHEKSFSEELLIRTDRDLYASGERVWVKIYKLNGLTHTPDNHSKVVYVDILDLENNPVSQLKIEMNSFSCSGDFLLPDTLRTGNYVVRSYTNWMQNFSRDLYAYKRITVINPFENIANLKIPSVPQNPDSVTFYPEGGHLQAGFETKLGFRATGRGRSPVSMKGAIINDNNDTICLVSTGRNGYGIVTIRPLAAGPMFLASTYKNQVKKFPLPAVQQEGVIISAASKNNTSGLLASLKISSNYVPDGEDLFLVINSSGLSRIKRVIKPQKDLTISVSPSDLPNGISQLMITDDHGNILTERWISNENSGRISYKITMPDNGSHPREKVKIEISATDSKGNPVASDLSVSVVKAVSVKNQGPDIDNFRQLPGMASVSEDCAISDVNDFLVFYRPHDVMSENTGIQAGDVPLFLPEMEGHLISGSIKDRVSGEPLKNEHITLSFVGKSALCLFTKTDANGSFNFVTKEHGLKEIVIQPLTPAKECYVDLNNPIPARYNEYDHGSFYLDTARLDEINNLIISMQINNIYEPFYQTGTARSEEAAKHNFYGKPDNSILMSKYIELTSVREIVAELIPGVNTTRSNGKINFRLTKPYQSKPYENGPLVLVDGVPVYDLEKVIGINSKDVEKVDVLIDRYFIAGNALDGIIHFITYKGNLSALDLDKSVFRMEYNLLMKRENFYTPDYSVDSVRTNHLPDFRNTLYWNPDLHTGDDGKTSAGFYSSDEPGSYIIKVEGMTPDGKTGTASLPLIIVNRK